MHTLNRIVRKNSSIETNLLLLILVIIHVCNKQYYTSFTYNIQENNVLIYVSYSNKAV